MFIQKVKQTRPQLLQMASSYLTHTHKHTHLPSANNRAVCGKKKEREEWNDMKKTLDR